MSPLLRLFTRHPDTTDKDTDLMEAFNKPATARDALKFAKADLIADEDRLRRAKADTAAAQKHVDTAKMVVAKHDDYARRQTMASADAMVQAIKAGADVSVIEPPTPSSSRIAAADRLKVAEAALAELQTDERVVSAVVDVSKAEVAKAVKEVVREEALRLAARIELLEGEANDQRAMLGLPGGWIMAALHPCGEKLATVIRKSERIDELAVTNAPLNLKAKDSGKVWAAFAEALMADPHAPLKFA